MDAAGNRVLTGDPHRLVTAALVWLPLIALAALPIVRARWGVIDSVVAAKGVVGLLEAAFVLAVLWRHATQAPRFSFAAGTLLAAWFAWTSLAVMQADHFAIALVRHVEWIAHGLFAYALYVLMRADAGAARHLIRLLAAGALIFFVELVLFRITLPESGAGLFYDIPGFGNIRHLGHYAVVIALLPVALMMSAEDTLGHPSWTDRLLAAVALSVGWCFLFWTGGRGPLLAILVGSLVLACVRGGPSLRPLLPWIAGTATAGFALAALLGVPGYGVERIGARMFGSLESAERFSSGRLPIWSDAFTEAAMSPLFGLGPDGYLFIAQAGERFMHPHAFPLQASLEWGIPGVVFTAALIMLFALRHRRLPAVAAPAGWALLSLLALSMIDGTLYFPYPMMLAAACLALVSAGTFDSGYDALAPHSTTVPLLVAATCVAVLSIHMVSVVQAIAAPADDGAPPRLLITFPSGMTDARAPGRLWKRLATCDTSGRSDCIDVAVAAARNARPPAAWHFHEAAERMAADEPGMQAFFRQRTPLLYSTPSPGNQPQSDR